MMYINDPLLRFLVIYNIRNNTYMEPYHIPVKVYFNLYLINTSWEYLELFEICSIDIIYLPCRY